MTTQQMSAETRSTKRMKHDVLINSFDKERLMRLLQTADPSAEVREELEDLTWELQRGCEVRPLGGSSRCRHNELVGSCDRPRFVDLSCLYDRVPVGRELRTRTNLDFCTVRYGPPRIPQRRHRVLACSRGIRQIRIDDIVYQPEAAGDYHL